MLEIKFSKLAQSDIAGIYDYTVDQWGVEQADRYVDGLSDRLEQAARGQIPYPALPQWRHDGFSLSYKSHVIFFVRTEHEVVVARVLHNRMDLLRHLDNPSF